jgi:hypothetical protein
VGVVKQSELQGVEITQVRRYAKSPRVWCKTSPDVDLDELMYRGDGDLKNCHEIQ